MAGGPFALTIQQALVTQLSTPDGTPLTTSPVDLSSVGGVAPSLVWQPGGTAGGNVFTTWATLYEAIQSLLPAFYTVGIDTTFAAAQVPSAPVGGWILGGASKWQGIRSSTEFLPFVTFLSGATIANSTQFLQLDYAEFLSSSPAGSPVWDFNLTQTGLLVLGESAGISCTAGAGPFLRVQQTAPLFTVCALRFGRIGVLGVGAAGVIQPTVGGRNLIVETDQQTNVAVGSFVAVAGADAENIYFAGTGNNPIPMPAGWTLTLGSRAQVVSYAPATPGNWAGTAPTQVSNAIDRLAALAVTLNGGTPIP